MIKRASDVKVNNKNNDLGNVKMLMSDLREFEGINSKIRIFSHIKLNAGESMEFHKHVGECELYYILSGKALYNNNGEKVSLEDGDVTYTPSGEGHGIENTGNDILEYIALIVMD